jgi:ABC-type nitrate/sulfonate/bicarbonate transport system substrate-binding protein
MASWTRRRLITWAASASGLAALPDVCPGDSARANDARVRIVTGLRAATQCIAWIGTEAGVFRKHGVDAVFPKLEVGGPQSVAGLLRGDWEFAQTGTVPIAEAVLNGGDPVILLRNHDPHDDRFVMTRREITDLNQLAGRKVGVLTDAYSGQTGVRTRLAIEKAGTTAVYVGLGTFESIYAALGRGEIDAGALPIDLRFAGQRQYGWNAFAAGADVPSILATTRKLIATDREVAVNVVRAVIETIFIFKTQPAVAAPLLQRFLHFTDPQAAEDLRAFYAPLLPMVPRPNLAGGMQHLRTLFATRYPAAAKLQETDIVDPSIIDEVDRSGFIERLYGKRSTP